MAVYIAENPVMRPWLELHSIDLVFSLFTMMDVDAKATAIPTAARSPSCDINLMQSSPIGSPTLTSAESFSSDSSAGLNELYLQLYWALHCLPAREDPLQAQFLEGFGGNW